MRFPSCHGDWKRYKRIKQEHCLWNMVLFSFTVGFTQAIHAIRFYHNSQRHSVWCNFQWKLCRKTLLYTSLMLIGKSWGKKNEFLLNHEFIFCYHTSCAFATLRFGMLVDKKHPQRATLQLVGNFFFLESEGCWSWKSYFFLNHSKNLLIWQRVASCNSLTCP